MEHRLVTMSDLDHEMNLCLGEMPSILTHSEFLSKMYYVGEMEGLQHHDIDECANQIYQQVSDCTTMRNSECTNKTI